MSEQTDVLRSSGDAASVAYEHILREILSGSLEPGARLREQSIAAATGVSRTPVRQALNRLAAEGIVVIEPHRGAQVARYDDAEITGMLELRAKIEPQAVRSAVSLLGEQHLEQLAQLNDQMIALAKAGEAWAELAELNTRFHGVFIDNCGSRPLAVTVRTLVRPAMVIRTFERYSASALERSMQHHTELVEASRCGDGEWAESVMCSHILAARHAYRDSH